MCCLVALAGCVLAGRVGDVRAKLTSDDYVCVVTHTPTFETHPHSPW